MVQKANIPEKAEAASLEEIVVVGGNALAREVASLASAKGLKVKLLCDLNGEVETIIEAIGKALEKKVSKWTLSGSEAKAILSRIEAKVLNGDPHLTARLVVNLASGEFKKRACRRLSKVIPVDGIIAVNLGGEELDELLSDIPRKDRFVGIRVFPPFWKTRLVEVLSRPGGIPEVLVELIEKLDKKGIIIPAGAGTFSAKAFVSLFNEAAAMLDKKSSNVGDIDAVLKDSLGMLNGPFGLADIIGLDNVQSWCDVLAEAYGNNRFASPDVLKQKVREGSLGVDSGAGFFDYPRDSAK